MWSSVVSLALAAALAQAMAVQAPPSVVVLESLGRPVGIAGLVDSGGLLLAHRSAVPQGQLLARTLAGEQRAVVQVAASDEVTQLVVLRLNQPLPGLGAPIKLAKRAPTLGSKVIAWTPTGPQQGEYVRGGLPGLMKPSMRYAPLSELRFETSLDRVGGALLFDGEGHLFGVLSATLDAVDTVVAQRTFAAGGFAGGGFAGGSQGMANQQYGPLGLTVAYALEPSVLRRVVAGFAGPAGVVEHPSLGVFFTEDVQNGAVLLERVLPGSPAARAGLEAGDEVVSVDGIRLSSAIDFAVALFGAEIGSTMTLQIARRGEPRTVALVVASHLDFPELTKQQRRGPE